MNKKKIRFNLIDAILLLLVAAVAFVVLYVFVFSAKDTSTSQTIYRNIKYVVEVQNVDEECEDLVKAGQSVQDAIERKNLGKVSGVQAVPFRKVTFNYNTGKETVAEVDGKITLKITISVQAAETERAFTSDGAVIRIGEKYSLVLPDMYCVGYCTAIIDDSNN